jgi:L-amino acid N-acyltransferase YncA
MGLTIRSATQEDADAIAGVHVRAWQWAYRGLMPDALLDGLSVAERAPRWHEQLRGDAKQAWVAEEGGRVIGFVSFGATDDFALAPETGEIFALYVEQAVLGRGIGRALFARAVDELRARGHEDAVLWVLDSNLRGRRFYERAGFTADGSSKQSTRAGHTRTEVRYRLRLSGR